MERFHVINEVKESRSGGIHCDDSLEKGMSFVTIVGWLTSVSLCSSSLLNGRVVLWLLSSCLMALFH